MNNGGIVILLGGVLLMILGFKGTARNVWNAAVGNNAAPGDNGKVSPNPGSTGS